MIDGDIAINIIESRLTNLIRQGQLNAKFKKSNKSISFYLRDIDDGIQPLLTLRLSNHRPDFQGYIKKEFVLPNNTNNVSIEFYKPRRKDDGRLAKNRIKNVIDAETFKNLTPFAITSCSYRPKDLEWTDFEKIYQAILSFIQTKTYTDPLAGTPQSANSKTKISTSKMTKYAVPQNISVRDGDYPTAATILTNGADYVPEHKVHTTNSNKIRLTESEFHTLISECVRKILKQVI